MKTFVTVHRSEALHTIAPATLLVLLTLFAPATFAVIASDITTDAHTTYSVTLGDVDGDGDLDLIAGNYNQMNRLYLNNGSGVFGDGIGGTTGSNITTDAHVTISVALGDVDGDGDLDLIAGNSGQANRLYLNDGNGVFGDGLGGTTGSDITTDTHATRSVILGDVDGDGDLDLLVGNYSQVNRLYLNNGSGVFGDGLGGTTGNDITTDIHATQSVALGDVDGDGDLDLIAGNSGEINRLYLNNGSGVFGDGLGGTTGSNITADAHLTTSVALGDVDGDGDLDLIAGNNSHVNRLYLNNGSGVFGDGLGGTTGSNITADNHTTYSVALGDVDGDGDLDLIVGNYGQANRLYLNDGSGVFGNGLGGTTSINLTADTHNTWSVTLGDVDDDGKLDLIGGNYGEINRLYLNNGSGVFGDGLGGTTGSDITTNTNATRSITLGDVDGDSDLDLIAGNSGQVNRLYLNDGNGVFGDGLGGTTGSDITTDTHATRSVILGDVDGDGDLDLLVGNYSQVNRLYLNNGSGVFGDGLGGTIGSDISSDTHNTRSVTLGDVDGDGDLDLIASNNSQVNRLYLNNGSGVFGDGLGGTTGSNLTTDTQATLSVTLGDVDGDGDLDLIAGNNGQVNRLYLNNGSGVFGDGIGGTIGSDITSDIHTTQSVTLGDVDGDGDLDLIAGNNGQVNRLYLNNGSGVFGNGHGGTNGSDITIDIHATYSVTLDDVDGDGDLDLIAGNNGQVNRLYLNNGSGVFGNGLGNITGSDITSDTHNTWSVVLGEINGDGHLDLIAGNNAQTNRLYLNRSNQLALQVWTPERQTGITRQEPTLPVVDIAMTCIGNATGAASLDYRFEYITATAPDFYPNLASGTLSWPNGQCASKTIPLPVFNDNIDEGTETLWLVLENPVNLYNSNPASQVKRYRITIIDDDTDSDGDGYVDTIDAFPNDYTEWLDSDGDGIGDNADTDDDNDGVLDVDDAFPLDATEQYDTDGDGIGNNADTDDDGDGILDIYDAFPLDATESVDTDGDGVGDNLDTDDDNDGVGDSFDAFPLDPAEQYDTDGDGIGNNADPDDDNDGILDVNDAFPLGSTESVDTDGDGIGDNLDTDDDNDGVGDSFDAFPLDPAEQYDTDGDGIGNNADPDDDNDGILDINDAFPLGSTESVDTDGDGIGDNLDTDDDNDGVLDTDDAFPLDPAEQYDTDGDGIGNNTDTDDDGDGVLDVDDAFPLDAAESVDTDGDGIGNNADTDDDGDGVPDADDAFPLDPTRSAAASNGGGGGGALNVWLLALMLPLLTRVRRRR